MACGTPLEHRCPACGRALPPDAAFCDTCGQPVATPSAAAGPDASERDPRAYTPKHLARRILTSRGALEGERKRVTVLFADLAGFTSLSESRDPEEMHALMDRFFQLVLTEVHRFEGTVNQFLGDGVMALFGAPVALEDAPRRGVSAALAIRRGLAALEEETAPERRTGLALRIGIHSGHVVVGRIGDDLRMDYTAVGDTTNVASRLQHAAEAGQIVISDATHRLVEGYCTVQTLGELSLKGKAEPMPAWEVLAARESRTRLEVEAEHGLTPYVGRERERQLVSDCFRQVRSGQGQVVFVVGEAGIGKSRFLLEVRRQLGTEVA
jgi:class 3 adenylate cyclase